MAKGKEIAKRRELDKDRRPWEMQSWEGLKAFEAFCFYRNLLMGASLSKAVQDFLKTAPSAKGRNEATVRRQFGEWSAENMWVSRTEALVMHLDDRHREQIEGRITRQNRRYETAAATLSSGILARAAVDPDAGVGEADGQLVQPFDFNELDIESAARALVALQRLERLATGQATELAKGAFQISTSDVERIVREFYELTVPFVAEDRQPLWAQAIQSWIQGGGRGQLAA